MSAATAISMRALLAQTRLELVLALRRGESVLVTLVMPLLLLVFFGSVPILSVQVGSPVDFLLPGLLALSVISTSMVSLGIATAFERQYGVLKRLGGSPLPRAGLLVAKIMSVIVIEALEIVLLVAVAALFFGWRPHGEPVLALLVLLIGTIAFASLGLLLAGALRAEATLAGANGLYLVFLLLGDMLFPLDQLPSWLGRIAEVLPPAAFSEALRASLQSGAPFPLGSIALLCFWGAVFLVLAIRTFQWE